MKTAPTSAWNGTSAEDTAVITELIRIGARFGLEPAATQPVYCLQEEERPLLRLLSAINQNCPLEQVPAATIPGFDDPQIDVHWLPPETVIERFAAFPDAISNAAHIADQCQPCLPNGRPLWPTLDLPEEQTVEEALEIQAQSGLEKKQ